MTPVAFSWDGDAMVPLERFRRLCDKQYVVGEVYTLLPHEQRSAETHRHYFAAIHDAWLNLPEDQTERFASSEHLRKWALIKAGYANRQEIVAATKAEAQRLAVLAKSLDQYAVATVAGNVVTIFTAQSQSMRAMGKAAFQDSKQKVLDVCADMVGVKPRELERNAGRAA